MTQTYNERKEYIGHRELNPFYIVKPKYRDSRHKAKEEARQMSELELMIEKENLQSAVELGIVDRADARYKQAVGRLYENENNYP